MPHKTSSKSPALKQRAVISTSRSSKMLLIRRLREIDRLSNRELAAIMADADKIRAAFRLSK